MSTFMTIEEEAQGKKTKNKKKNGGPKGDAKPDPDEAHKKPKDLLHIKCPRCHEMGHYANKCPQKKEQYQATLVDAT